MAHERVATPRSGERGATLLLATVMPLLVHGQEVPFPGEVEGLVARYAINSDQLGRTRRADVETWRDTSGYGYDLTLEEDGEPATRRALRLNQQGTIEPRKGAYDVREPFELDDHTIFVVSSCASIDRALFSSDADPTSGVVMYAMGPNHVLHDGTPVAYTKIERRSAGFHVIVLGRQAGLMRAFVDGVDVSSGQRTSAPLRVGRFFQIDYGPRRKKDGAGLEIAEMLFYDRFLSRDDRGAVTDYLSQRYGLQRLFEQQAAVDGLDAPGNVPVARFFTEKAMDLNVLEGVAVVSWAARESPPAPIEHDPEGIPSRIVCASGGASIRVRLSLALSASNPGSNVRVLLLKNDTEYLEDDAVSGEFGGEGEAGTAKIELETTVFLDKGDWIEVVAQGIGAEGEVLLVPDQTRFVARALGTE